MAGWFMSSEDCAQAIGMVMHSWQPTIGFYGLQCVVRLAI